MVRHTNNLKPRFPGSRDGFALLRRIVRRGSLSAWNEAVAKQLLVSGYASIQRGHLVPTEKGREIAATHASNQYDRTKPAFSGSRDAFAMLTRAVTRGSLRNYNDAIAEELLLSGHAVLAEGALVPSEIGRQVAATHRSQKT